MATYPWCRAWTITRTDGAIIGATDSDLSFIYNGVTYYARSGFNATATSQNKDLSVNNVSFTSLIDSEGITEIDLLSGKYELAQLTVFIYDWMQQQSVRVLFQGYFGDSTLSYDIEGAQKFTVNAFSQEVKLNQKSTQYTTNYCRHKFGVMGAGLCNKDTTSLTGEFVIDTVSPDGSTLNFSNPQPAGYWDRGTITYTSGQLNGTKAHVISSSSGGVGIFSPYSIAPQSGDSFIIIPGCKKNVDNCKYYDNIQHHGGFPYLPGIEVLSQGTVNLPSDASDSSTQPNFIATDL